MRFALLLLPLMACTPPAPNAGGTPPPNGAAGERGLAAAPAPGDTTVVGTVRVVGSLPVNVRVVVQPAGGGSATVAGPLTEEIRRLAGAEVAVAGRWEGGELHAERYEVRAVDGQPVVTGTVERVQSDYLLLRTERGEAVYVYGAGAEFRVGQKLWVQGPHSVRLQSYGVIKP